tara:strand:+ start:3931 stop:5526 length:1596 start_codon:yes stop_codon:yes gene_type:complete
MQKIEINSFFSDVLTVYKLLKKIKKIKFFFFVLLLILSSTFIDAFLITKLADLNDLSQISEILLLLIGFRFLIMFLSLYLSISFSYDVFKKMCTLALDNLISFEEYSKVVTDRDSYTRIINADILMVSRGYILQFVNIITDSLTLSFITFALLIGYEIEYVVIFATIIFLFGFLQFLLSLFTQKTGKIRSTYDRERFNVSREALQMIDTLVVTRTKGFFINKFREALYNFAKSLKLSTFIIQSSRLQLELFIVIIFILSVTVFTFVNQNFTEGMFAALGFAFLRVIPAFSRISASFQQLSFSKAALKSVYPIILKKDEISENSEYENFEFLDINLVQQDKKVRSLIKIKKGKKYVISGPSGSGKSSFLKSILGLKEQYISEEKLQCIPSLENFKIAYVPQDINLFNSDLFENVTLKSKNICSQDELLLFDGLIIDLGLNNLEKEQILGTDAAKLSGGERQRLSIARALFQRPDILFMDEFSSALDNESAYKVLKTCKEICSTIIYISHDASMIKEADFEIRLKTHNQYEII